MRKTIRLWIITDPAPENLPSQVEYQLTEHGGHVGFIGGTLRRPEMWLEKHPGLADNVSGASK
jgi:predicted alpha/beta-fold hydrolase